MRGFYSTAGIDPHGVMAMWVGRYRARYCELAYGTEAGLGDNAEGDDRREYNFAPPPPACHAYPRATQEGTQIRSSTSPSALP